MSVKVPKSDLWGAIRKHCLHSCQSGSYKAVRNCRSSGCHLWLYRLGSRAVGEASQIDSERKSNKTVCQLRDAEA